MHAFCRVLLWPFLADDCINARNFHIALNSRYIRSFTSISFASSFFSSLVCFFSSLNKSVYILLWLGNPFRVIHSWEVNTSTTSTFVEWLFAVQATISDQFLLFVTWRHLKQIWMNIEMHSRFKFFVDPSTNLEMHCQFVIFVFSLNILFISLSIFSKCTQMVDMIHTYMVYSYNSGINTGTGAIELLSFQVYFFGFMWIYKKNSTQRAENFHW